MTSTKAILTFFGTVLVVSFLGAMVLDKCINRSSQESPPIKEKKIGTNKIFAFGYEYVMIDGHQYLMYLDGYRGGITHSPKCDCLKKQATEGNENE